MKKDLQRKNNRILKKYQSLTYYVFENENAIWIFNKSVLMQLILQQNESNKDIH